MQGRRGSRGPFFDFGDPFAGFGGFEGQRSLLSGFFGGRDPFDDPFFTQPFGGMFESGFFGSGGRPFADMHPSGYIEHQASGPINSRGPIIEEIDSDNEKDGADKEKKENPRKHGRSSKEPYVEDPDDEVEERKSKHLQHRNDYNRFNGMGSQPQGRSFTFQSSSVTYGGANGAYYTSSKTRRTGSDGVSIEESKEADSTTRQATHLLSRGLHNKGHTLTRKLSSDGRVDTMQTLHNLGEDELFGFEEAWKGNAGKHLPGWTGSLSNIDNIGASSSGQNVFANRGCQALPPTELPQYSGRMLPPNAAERAGSTHSQQPGRRKGSSNVKDKSDYPRWRPNN